MRRDLFLQKHSPIPPGISEEIILRLTQYFIHKQSHDILGTFDSKYSTQNVYKINYEYSKTTRAHWEVY